MSRKGGGGGKLDGDSGKLLVSSSETCLVRETPLDSRGLLLSVSFNEMGWFISETRGSSADWRSKSTGSCNSRASGLDLCDVDSSVFDSVAVEALRDDRETAWVRLRCRFSTLRPAIAASFEVLTAASSPESDVVGEQGLGKSEELDRDLPQGPAWLGDLPHLCVGGRLGLCDLILSQPRVPIVLASIIFGGWTFCKEGDGDLNGEKHGLGDRLTVL